MENFQKLGGAAALSHTTALVVGMVLSFTWMFPLLDAAPDQAQRFLSSHQSLVILWTVIVDWGSAITLVIMLLALYERLKTPWMLITRTVGLLPLIFGTTRKNLYVSMIVHILANSVGFFTGMIFIIRMTQPGNLGL
jgi:hypothetical protein